MKVTLLLKKLDGTIEIKVVDTEHKLSEHFKVKEFLVNINDNLDLACVSEYDIETYETIRIILGLPVSPTSGGRTTEYNARKEIGGSSISKHPYLFDVNDFKVIGATDEQLDNIYKYLIFRDYTGIGRYEEYRFHADRGYRNKLTVWDER